MSYEQRGQSAIKFAIRIVSGLKNIDWLAEASASMLAVDLGLGISLELAVSQNADLWIAEWCVELAEKLEFEEEYDTIQATKSSWLDVL